jgi:hypothetical protein
MDLIAQAALGPCANGDIGLVLAAQSAWLGQGNGIAARHAGIAEHAPFAVEAKAVARRCRHGKASKQRCHKGRAKGSHGTGRERNGHHAVLLQIFRQKGKSGARTQIS